MADKTLNFTVNLNGTAYTGIAQIDATMGKLNITSNKTEKRSKKKDVSSLVFIWLQVRA